MAAVRSPTPLNDAVKAARAALVPTAIFSLFINLLALVSPLYMLQVYDRVLGSRNEWTLVFLTVIAVFLYLVYGSLEALRARVLIRGGARFENMLRSPLFEASFMATLGRRSGAGDAQAFRDADADVAATLRNSEVMRAMGMAPGLKERWGQRRDEQIAWQAVASDRGSALTASMKSFRQITQVFILGLGGYLCIQGDLSAGGIVAASIIVGRALAPIEIAVSQWRNFQNSRGAWSRLQDLFRANPQDVRRMELPAPQGTIMFEQGFAAPPGDRAPVLRGISFQLEKGKTLAIIGPSAAGKSSLVRVLLGVWPAVAGTVRLDGFAVNQFDPNELGPYVGYLPQDVELFSGTVAQNIARFREADHAGIICAARLAGVHEMVQQMPNGYNTEIGDSGQSLSGGQRQRIGLARALFGNPSVVVLDEPNANLDAAGDTALTEAVRHLKAGGTTVVFVTHKSNMLQLADQVLLMDQGTVRLYGERDEVMAHFSGPKVVPTSPHPHVAAVPTPTVQAPAAAS